jgi:hypothetical protein
VQMQETPWREKTEQQFHTQVWISSPYSTPSSLVARIYDLHAQTWRFSVATGTGDLKKINNAPRQSWASPATCEIQPELGHWPLPRGLKLHSIVPPSHPMLCLHDARTSSISEIPASSNHLVSILNKLSATDPTCITPTSSWPKSVCNSHLCPT